MATNKKYNEKLERIFYNPEHNAGFSNVDKLWLAVEKKIPKKYITTFLENQNTYTVNRSRRKKFKRLHYEVNNIDDLWQIDLIDFTSIKQHNDGFSYILTCIDTFSKYLWMEKLKNKSSKEVLKAFKLMLKGRKCRNLMSDSGSEFCNKTFKDFLAKNDINFYQNVDDATHACIVERVILTVKRKLFKYLYFKKTYRYIDVYKKICKSYNSSYHKTIKMRPIDVCDTNIVEVYKNIQESHKKSNHKKPKFRIGLFVRISRKKDVFAKGSEGQNFTEEIFKIIGVFNHNPPMYKIEDLLGESIKGKFYESEMQKVMFDPDAQFDIDKIIRKRKINGNHQFLVSWIGWPPKFTSWIDSKDIIHN